MDTEKQLVLELSLILDELLVHFELLLLTVEEPVTVLIL